MGLRICIVGLGNPGARYQGTRHNIGFEWVDSCVSQLGLGPWSQRFEAEWCEGRYLDMPLHFLKPTTFMNLSGKALTAWSNKFQGNNRVLAVYDDMDLPVGRMRLRAEGSDGGHRGLRSLLQDSAHRPLFRLRIGVGRPPEGALDHVLGTFSPPEKETLSRLCGDAKNHLAAWMELPWERAMNQLNGTDYSHGT